MFNTPSVAKTFNELFFELKASTPYALRFNAFGENKGFEIVNGVDDAIYLEELRGILDLEHVAQAFNDLYFFLKEETPYTLRFNTFGDNKGFEIVDENISAVNLDNMRGMLSAIGVEVTFSQIDGGETFIENFKGERNLRKYVQGMCEKNTGFSYQHA